MTSRFLLPVSTILALLAGFFVYYILVISRQEASLDERGFRSLAAVSSQFSDLINTVAGVLDRTTSHTGNQGDKDVDIAEFLKTQVPDLEDVKQGAQCAFDLSAATVVNDTGYKLGLASRGWCADISFEKSFVPLLGDSNQIFDEIILADGFGVVLYQTQRMGIVADNLSFLPWSIEDHSVSQSKNSATSKGESGGKAAPTGSAANAVAGSFLDVSGSSNIFRLVLAGTDYRAYVIPVRIAMPASSTAKSSQQPNRLHFVLCGLVRQSSFRSQSRSLPFTVLMAIALAVMLVIVAAWPVLKFETMRRTEEIPPRAGLYYALSITGTLILLILLLVHIQYVFYDPQRSTNLDDLAAAIDEHVGQEVEQLLVMMQSVSESPGVQKVVPRQETPCTADDPKAPAPEKDLLSKVGMQVAAFPYFRRIFLYDQWGFEHIRWTVDSQAPSPLRACDRPYFKGVLRNDLWFMTKEGLSGHRFRIDPVYAKGTGEYLAAIAEPFPPPQYQYPNQLPNRPAIKGVMMIATPLLSLIHPVLPPDYGFAVIDETGKVLFHSDATKNGRENFFDESGDSSELRTATLARQKRLLTVTYLGSKHQVLVKPFTTIQQCPWTLIVFSDLTALGDKQLNRILLMAVLACIYFVFFAAAVALLRWWIPCNEMAWPAERKRTTYRQLIVTLTIVTCLSLMMIFQCNPKQLLWLPLFVSTSALLFVVFKLKSLSGSIRSAASVFAGIMLVLLFSDIHYSVRLWNSPYATTVLVCVAYLSLGWEPDIDAAQQYKQWPLSRLFSLAGFCLLILVAAVPCLGFLKLSYDYDEYLSTRREQLLTMAALDKREHRVVSQYITTKISTKAEPYTNDLGKWLFLRRRLEEQKLDLYDNVFRDQRTGQIYSAEPLSAVDNCASTAMAAGDESRRSGRWPGWFIWIAANLVPHRRGSLTHELEGTGDTSKWGWSEEGVNRLRIHRKYDPECSAGLAGSPETTALAKLAMNDPTFLTQNLTYDLNVLNLSNVPWPAVPAFVVLLVGVWWSVHSTMRHMFAMGLNLKDCWQTVTLAQALARKQNSILVGPPCSGKTKLLKEQAKAGHFTLIDAAEGLRDERVTWNLDASVFVLDHFEVGRDDEAASRKKLNLLEELDRRGKKVLIVTTVEPRFHLNTSSGNPPEVAKENITGELERWARILAKFDVFALQDVVPVKSDAYYQFLWLACCLDEKIALYPLTKNGWPNHKNHLALEHAWKKGLLLTDPLRFKDNRFKEFISGSVSSSERRSWQHHDTSGTWDSLRTVLIVLCFAAIAAVLFFNQNELLGSIAGVTSVLTAANKIIADVRGGRSTTSAEGA